MEKYCIFCGQTLKDGVCINPECRTNTKKKGQAPQGSSWKKPISLLDRRRQMQELEIGEEGGRTGTNIEYIERSGDKRLPPSTEFDEEKENLEETDASDLPPVTDRKREHLGSSIEETPVPPKAAPATKSGGKIVTENKTTSAKGDLQPIGGLIRFCFFICDYFREPGKVVTAAARKRDVGTGSVLVFTSIILSALGTLLFGSMHLEDFFLRWIVGGILAPIFACGVSLLYGSLFVFFSPYGRERRRNKERVRRPFGELFAAVTAPSVFPNLLLLLSCIFSPMDESLGIFQFFALLITISWVISLVLSLFAVYGGGFSLGGLVLTVAFALLTFLAMRAVWVWYLTGEFRFALYIPLSVFLS